MITPKHTFTLLACLLLANLSFAQTVTINEFMADNDSLTQIVDEAGQYDDWIELHNNTNQTIDLSGYNLSDNGDNLDKWTIPSGTSINANGYLIIWADDDASQGPLHATFKLGKDGESIYLTTANETHVDSVQFGEQDANISMARIPNGTGPFIQQAPTFGFNNDGTMSVNTPVNDAAFKLYPNPITSQSFLEWNEADHVGTLDLSIFDAQGKLISQFEVTQNGPTTKIDLPLENLTSGAYFLHLNTEVYHANRTLIIK